MKSANEDLFTCSMFDQYLSEFIDDDLNEEIKGNFLSHAAVCENCNLNLKESIRLKRVLGQLSPVSVSPEFDYRLKARIHLETTRLKNPLYRFKLFINDNMKDLLIVPAFALIILWVVFSSIDMHLNQQNQSEITQNNVSSTHSDSTFEDYPEEIHYVLDSVKPSEVETGIFLNEHDTSIQTTSTDHNFTLTSF